ncbi:hypothetical protein M422DRAFT_59702 [Sphaerobolus stellatus SS14]|uniref:DNA mismatch repair proteins mutS family domain-containing protein n=1 Tax=Sphaerobolus stellatus (strain SS14) TaxID=990650 RepID=A0A0C9VEQ9_SPHS4|nr:hypothetical protein M422DRAFT_59702 [Sphaerobolus stellatus SS14]
MNKGPRVRLPQNDLAVEILANLSKFPRCILLTRVGNFYESYFDQASEVAHLLSIKLTKRTWDRQEVLMCGFPIMHLDRHLKVLIQVHKRCVALSEEFKRDPPEQGFSRRVVRILTPGTLIDESFLNPYENNYLLAIHAVTLDQSFTDRKESDLVTDDIALGLAWIDVSTGEFFSGISDIAGLKDELARIAPREVVLHDALRDQLFHPLRQALTAEGCFMTYMMPQKHQDLQLKSAQTDDLVSTAVEASHECELSSNEVAAVNLLTTFLQAHLLDHMPSISSFTRTNVQNRMHIDSHTIKALEIREELREGGISGSLLSVINKTLTTSGSRLLGRWLGTPSTSVREIRARQNLVSIFRSRHHLRADIIEHLKRLEDASRVVQRFLLGRGDVSDLIIIRSAIEIWSAIEEKIRIEHNSELKRNIPTPMDEWEDLISLMGRMSNLQHLADRIAMAITPRIMEHIDDLPDGEDVVSEDIKDNYMTTNWLTQVNFSPELTTLHNRLADAQASRQRLEEDLQLRLDARSLSLRYSNKYGVHVHINRPNRDAGKIQGSRQFVQIGSTASSKMFFNQTWYLLGTEISHTITNIMIAERAAFEELRREVNSETLALRRNARIMDELDVTIGFANLANDMNFIRPIVDEGHSYHVVNGRHPVVELGLLNTGRTFTPNTVSLGQENRLHIITGPNMAGKSTLLRQTAILAILAQIGSFIPAESAQIGIVDKVFSRIGAKDDLFRDRSTFMVEMLETAEILKNATPQSLVIMDEVGRGTTVKDGLAIAFATVHHLYNVNRSRALFATHFHEVVDLLGYNEDHGYRGHFPNMGFYCTDIHETEDGHFAYSHRLREGVNRDSHGMKVAQLAGLPLSAIHMATETLDCLKHNEGAIMRNADQLRTLGASLVSQQSDKSS